ncbi:hypothetical protein RFI_18435 [Reticulomyxa filosa]|uniref:Uncharacterized protein n=1 Tax=Reticulomyxa filosa TaxID=46433 RepID=X6N0G5_RETFI|nr:hypothetical protein RFI_18435 [Reticulomyxa filosa]|eukprot:ETO18812.1 hypothetical protein RFI_18435 [Reticulomyxa filosa]
MAPKKKSNNKKIANLTILIWPMFFWFPRLKFQIEFLNRMIFFSKLEVFFYKNYVFINTLLKSARENGNSKTIDSEFFMGQDKKNIFMKIGLADVVNKIAQYLIKRVVSFLAKRKVRMHGDPVDWPKNHNVFFLLTLYKIDWEKFIDEYDSHKKRLDMKNDNWKNTRPRPTPTPKEWDKLSEFVFFQMKRKIKKNKKENKKEECICR